MEAGGERNAQFQPARMFSKLVGVILGVAWEVVLDLLRDSPTYGQWVTVALIEDEQIPVLNCFRLRPRLRHLQVWPEHRYRLDTESDRRLSLGDPKSVLALSIKDVLMSDNDVKKFTLKDQRKIGHSQMTKISLLKSFLLRKAKSAIRHMVRASKSILSFIHDEMGADRKQDEIEASRLTIWKSDMCGISEARPICMFAQYAFDERLNDNTVAYMQALRSCGIDIILISTCEQMSKEEIDRALVYCGMVITRKNIGYDFYSWKIGCQVYPVYSSHPAMFWVNDSVVVDEQKVPRAVEAALRSTAGLFGLTDCYRHGYHLQSYFLRFTRSAMTSVEFHDFLNSINVHRHKPTIIRLYEVGLSRKVGAKNGLSSMIRAKDLRSLLNLKSLRRLNPTIDTWRELIEMFGFPFAKMELISRRGISMESIRTCFDHADSSARSGASDV